MPGLPEYIVEVDNEAFDAKSPDFEDVAGAEVLQEAPSGVDTTPIEEVEAEEEEVEKGRGKP